MEKIAYWVMGTVLAMILAALVVVSTERRLHTERVIKLQDAEIALLNAKSEVLELELNIQQLEVLEKLRRLDQTQNEIIRSLQLEMTTVTKEVVLTYNHFESIPVQLRISSTGRVVLTATTFRRHRNTEKLTEFLQTEALRLSSAGPVKVGSKHMFAFQGRSITNAYTVLLDDGRQEFSVHIGNNGQISGNTISATGL